MKGIVFVAPGGLTLVVPDRPSQSCVGRMASLVVSDKDRIVVVFGLIQQLMIQTVLNDCRMDPAPPQIPDHLFRIGVSFRKHQSLRLRFLLRI